MDLRLEQQVRERAGGICEYCQMPQEYDDLPFQIEHVIAQQHAGPTRLTNLALACAACNKYKGPNLAGIDSRTRRLVPLFHPRRMKWVRHFRWDGPVLIGRTPTGRATITVLGINRDFRVRPRAELINEGVFPPS
jgi:hypothetical protein